MSADPKDVVAVQDGSKLVDQPDYEKLCAEKQREIDKLQGMLEQKYGIVRRGLVKIWRGVTWPFRIAGKGAACAGRMLLAFVSSPIRVLTAPSRAVYRASGNDLMITAISHFTLAAIIATGGLALYLYKYDCDRAELTERQLVEAAKQPAIGIDELARYDGADVGQLFPDTKLVTLARGEKMEFVRVTDEIFNALKAFQDNDKVMTLNVVVLKKFFDAMRKNAEFQRRMAEASNQPVISQLSQLADYDGYRFAGHNQSTKAVAFQNGDGGKPEFLHLSDELFSGVVGQYYHSGSGAFSVLRLRSDLELIRFKAEQAMKEKKERDEALERIRNGEYDDKPEAK